MRNPLVAVVGVIVLGLGALFFFQGIGVVTGSTMTNTLTWSVLGPIIALAGLGLIVAGVRPRSPAPAGDDR